MAFTPSNIIQTPDFGSMAQNAMDRKRKEIAETNQFIDERQKVRGAYLEGDKEAVQGAWDKYQQSLDAMAENNSPEAKRAANAAYGDYVQLAGAAQANAQQYRAEVSAYKQDPTKFNLGGSSFMDVSNNYRLQKRTADDIMASVNEPFMLQRNNRYDLANPVDQAAKMYNMSLNKIGEFRNADGSINVEELEAYATKLATSLVNATDQSYEKALAWGGMHEGFAGEDGILQSGEELEFLKGQDDATKQSFIDAYTKELVKDYMQLVNTKSAPTEGGRPKQQMGSFSEVIIAAEVTKDGKEVPGTEISGDFLSLPADVNGITAVGRGSDGAIYVKEVETVEVSTNNPNDPLETKKEDRVSVRRATEEDLAQISTKYGSKYDFSALYAEEEEAEETTEDKPAEEAKPTEADPLGLGIEPAEAPAEDKPAEAPAEDPLGINSEEKPYQGEGDDPKDVAAAKTAQEPPVDKADPETSVVAEEVGNTVSRKKDEDKNPNPEGDYVVVNGRAYYRKDYDKVAGKRTNRGNYPETFDEYAEQMGVEILNTKDRPVSTVLDEVTVVAGTPGADPKFVGEEPAVEEPTEEPEVKTLNSKEFYEELLGAEGGISTDTKDLAAKDKGNQDAPKTVVDGKEVLQHTNKGVTYKVFKEWARRNGIDEKDYHDRFLNLTDQEVINIVDEYTVSAGADNFESPVLRALFTQNKWGTGNVIAGDLKAGRSADYRALIDWLQESTGIKFEGDPKTRTIEKFTPEEAKAIEDFYNKDPEGFIKEYTRRKKLYYTTLNTYETHGAGWERRADQLETALLAQIA